jgi:hypothetical protein
MNATTCVALKQVIAKTNLKRLRGLLHFGRVISDRRPSEDAFDAGLTHRMREAQDERHAFLSLLFRIQRSR